jgi:hypothetical protein
VSGRLPLVTRTLHPGHWAYHHDPTTGIAGSPAARRVRNM